MITNSYNLQANHTIKNFKSKLQSQGKIVSMVLFSQTSDKENKMIKRLLYIQINPNKIININNKESILNHQNIS